MSTHRVFGVTGWKNSGKTRLVCNLIKELTNRGLSVSTIKHAHKDFDIDHEGRDSHHHRMSGAREVAVSSATRWALVHELRGDEEASLEETLARLCPVDLVIIEGYKKCPHPKIECRRQEARSQEKIAPDDPTIIAIASNQPVDDTLPTFDFNDIPKLADFVLDYVGLTVKTNVTSPPLKSKPALSDCFVHDKERLTHAEALSIIKAQVKPLGDTEMIPLEAASNRVVAETITAPRPVPLTDNSAVDGYAFSHQAFEETGGWFPVATRVAAGATQSISLPHHAAARIFTGAPMPEGADTVAMQEDCESHEQEGALFVAIPPGLKKGANCRLAGEDIKKEDVLFTPGQKIGPADIAGLASNGRCDVRCYKPVRVALLATGDELITPGKTIQSGQVYNSNGPLLESLLRPLPVTVSNVGIVKDNLQTITTTLKELAAHHDVIVTTGGASLGEEDHISTALDTVGHRHMWQLAIKPGRPMTFGHVGDAAFIGLPGNPVAAFVCFLLYARQVILSLGGANWIEPTRFPLPSAFELTNKKANRREFLRGILRNEDGQLFADKFKRDGSGLISSLREADGLIEVDEDTTTINKGDRVHFIPFHAFGI